MKGVNNFASRSVSASLSVLIALAWFASIVQAQVASSLPYTLEQAIVSGGGGTSSGAGNVFKVESTIGEPVAGATSSNGGFIIKSGFFTAPALAPTAAAVSISGRVITPQELGLTNARVILTDMQGNTRTVLTGKAGGFRFTDVTVGETYILSVVSRRYIYAPQIITVTEDMTGVNFVPVGQ